MGPGLFPGNCRQSIKALSGKGLIYGETGRGTFVGTPKKTILASLLREDTDSPVVDLTLNSFKMLPSDKALSEAFSVVTDELLQHNNFSGYSKAIGSLEDREVGASWVSNWLDDISAENICITSGAQSGLFAALTTLYQPGTTVACEALTYPGTISICRKFSMPLKAIAIDENGLIPEALEEACKRFNISVLVVSSSVNNPTSTSLSDERRQKIAALAEKYDFYIVEDEVYGFLGDANIKQICHWAPQRCLFINSMSKAVAPALRTGYVVGHPPMVERLSHSIELSQMMVSPYLLKVVKQLIDSGYLLHRINEMKDVAKTRGELAQRCFGKFGVGKTDVGMIWLPIGSNWSVNEFVLEAERRGVLISSGAFFQVEGNMPPYHVRLSATSEPDIHKLQLAYSTLADMLEQHANIRSVMV